MEMKFQLGARVKHCDTGECGIVVSSWHDEQLDIEDYYVAFFGESFPIGKPEVIPYVLRYSQISLEAVS